MKLKGPRGYPKDITPERMFRKIKKTIFELGGVTRLHGLSRCTAFKNKTKFSVQGKKKLI